MPTYSVFQEFAEGLLSTHVHLSAESSKAFNTLSKILLWIKPAWFVTVMCATPGACIKPVCLARRCSTK